MRVKVAATAGFCSGVKRALEAVDKALESGKKVQTLGPIVHNEAILERLASRGVRVLDKADQADPQSAVAIRPHGAVAKDEEALRARGSRVLDTVCPYITRSREAIRSLSERGVNVIIAGNRDHGEVAVLREAVKTRCWVVGTTDEALTVAAEAPLALVAQSTFPTALFEDMAETLKDRFKEIEVQRETMCGATEERQAETRRLVQQADALVVVGPYHSSIARRLADIGREGGKQTFHVESPDEIPVQTVIEQARLSRQHSYFEENASDPGALQAATENPEIVEREVVIGVTAGASTPSWVTQAVVELLVNATGAQLVVADARGGGA